MRAITHALGLTCICEHLDAQVATEEGVPSFATSRISSNLSSTQVRVCVKHMRILHC